MKFFDQYRVVDLSMLIEPHWRFKPEFGFKEIPKPEFSFRSTVLQSYGAHNFSHCDAPQHVDRSMETIEQMDIRRFAGEASLIDVSDLGDNAPITREILADRGGGISAKGTLCFCGVIRRCAIPPRMKNTGRYLPG